MTELSKSFPMELKQIITTGPSYSENQIYPQSSEKCKTCNLQNMYHRIKGWMKNDSDITRRNTFHFPILRRRYSQLSPLSETLDTFAFRKVLYMWQPMKVKYIQRKFAFLVHIKQELVCGLFSNFLASPLKIYHVKTLKSCPFPSICIEKSF